MVLAYVSSLLGFPCETVTGGGGGYGIRPGVRSLPKGFHGLSRELAKLLFLKLCLILPSELHMATCTHLLAFYLWFVVYSLWPKLPNF